MAAGLWAAVRHGALAVLFVPSKFKVGKHMLRYEQFRKVEGREVWGPGNQIRQVPCNIRGGEKRPSTALARCKAGWLLAFS
jgi:hypothetical protein